MTSKNLKDRNSTLTWRSDIDGLRAIAVLVVIVFHAKVGVMPGGFVGVDIFFVISGFLIASIVLKEEEKKEFSLARFYERRVRRIFPALFLVIAASTAAGAVVLAPADYVEFGRSIIAAMAFFSNFHFANQAGYFAPAAETQPLLHTWSLGVEEQFYLVAPFVLLLFARQLRQWRLPIFAGLFVASVAVSMWGVATEAEWAFYLPHSRAFELMAGVALAMGLVPSVRNGRINEVLAVTGLLMIAYSVLYYSERTAFPGLAALVPVVGAALLIHSSTHASPTTVARMLSWRPVVYVGKISYSLYLWHWPLLAYAEYEFGPALEVWHRLGLLLAAVGLSALTYRYVEQPARHAGPPVTRRAVYAGGLVVILLCFGAREVIVEGKGLPGRLDPEVAALARDTPTRAVLGGLCSFGNERSNAKSAADCVVGSQAAAHPSFVLWGDSHRAVLAPLIAELASEAGISGFNVGRGGCVPLFGLDVHGREFRKCLAGSGEVEKLLHDPEITDVVLIGRWGLYAEGTRSPHERSTTLPRLAESDQAETRETFERLLRETVSKIRAAGKHVTVIGPVPELDVNLPAAFIKAAMRGNTANIVIARADFDERQQTVMPLLAEIERLEGVSVFYPHLALCDETYCDGSRDGVALYVDDDHLGPAGVALLEPMLRHMMDRMGRRSPTHADILPAEGG
ncbi:MAG: acyltransferase [Parvibaculum sp.]|nr:acyltransferase [Parvibaculum sp.]